MLTFCGMVVLTAVYWVLDFVANLAPSSAWVTILTHMSYINAWENTLGGRLEPKYLVFHVSAAILWLAMTVKVLEARKWR
jgi:hypothetical protein